MRRWLIIPPLFAVVTLIAFGYYGGFGAIRPKEVQDRPGAIEPPGQVNAPPVNEIPVTEGPGCKAGKAADYFPYKVGTIATYAGLGNEFASYTVKVLYQSGNKVEWRRASGGTTMAEIFQVDPQQVKRIYREGEAYDNTSRIPQPPNQSEVILKGPIQVGTQWTEGTTTYKIIAVDLTVPAMNQNVTCVVKVEAQSPTSLIHSYWHKQYGLLLTIFDPSGPNPIESRLSTFTP